MKSFGFIALLVFATIISCLGFRPAEALADSNTSEVTADHDTGKFGIGFHSTFPLSGISGKYWTPAGIGIQGFLMRAGISVPTEDISASITTLGGRFLFTVEEKSRAKLYLGAGMNYTDASVREDDEFSEDDESGGSGLGLEGIGGVEYSFSDLPNLGFAFEFGINFLRLSAEEFEDDELNLHFTTSGTVGIHYYF